MVAFCKPRIRSILRVIKQTAKQYKNVQLLCSLKGLIYRVEYLQVRCYTIAQQPQCVLAAVHVVPAYLCSPKDADKTCQFSVALCFSCVHYTR